MSMQTSKHLNILTFKHREKRMRI